MREILFRGKNIDLEWVEGDLLQNGVDYKTAIRENKEKLVERVISHTVGQYTDLTDKNGKKIFEGDIVKLFYKDGFEIGLIGWSNIDFRYKFASPDGTAYGFDVTDTFEVIGNIHDNPELLKGGEGK